MNFDFFLWPMLIPMILPILYTAIYKREFIMEIWTITFLMTFIVIAYWPLTCGLQSTANIITKFILFVLFPLLILYLLWRIAKNDKYEISFEQFGITEKGFEKSLKLGFLFLPLMLIVTLIARIMMIDGILDPNFPVGVVSFVESLTEEFFFRGFLFLYLISKTNLKIAYVTSLTSFILMHPQNLTTPFIASTIIQGFLTIEITRKTKNIIGAWVLHGTNRFFGIAIIPFFL